MINVLLAFFIAETKFKKKNQERRQEGRKERRKKGEGGMEKREKGRERELGRLREGGEGEKITL